MRQKILLSLMSLLVVTNLWAEIAQVNFAGLTEDNRICLLDSVKIDNITQSWQMVVDCEKNECVEIQVNDPIPASLNDMTNCEKELLYIPQNLICGIGTFSVFLKKSENVVIQVNDISGHTILSRSEYLEAGENQYQITLPNIGSYLLIARTASRTVSVKMINQMSLGRAQMTKVAQMSYLAPRRMVNNNSVNCTDFVRYIGYMTRQGQVVTDTITQHLCGGKETVTFIFPSATKQGQGIYLGVLGFNNQLYQKDFSLLTTSNISSYKNYINAFTTANGTILYHAVYNALDAINLCTVPQDLAKVTLVTFTDGLDVGSYRMNQNYKNGASYLAAVNKRIHRTMVDGVAVEAYAIGVKGSDVSDEARFESDLHQLASDSGKVYTVSNMDDVNTRFRDLAASIYNRNIEYSMSIKLPAQEPGNKIRFTFDDISDAANSLCYIEGEYDFTSVGVLQNVICSGLRCDNDTFWTSVADGMFDIFTIANIENNLGERISTSYLKQWYYVPNTGKWQINSEFTPSGNTTVTETRKSGIVMLVLDCSSSLSSDISKMKSAANAFLTILLGQDATIAKPSVSQATHSMDSCIATCTAEITNKGNLTIYNKGFCLSENANMDGVQYFYSFAGGDTIRCVFDNLTLGKTYYYCPFAENQVGRTYGAINSFVPRVNKRPSVSTDSVGNISYSKAVVYGRVVDDGGLSVSSRGVCYSLVPNPTIDDNAIASGRDTGVFVVNLSELEDSTLYYVRTYATNAKGTSYGNQISFVTKHKVALPKSGTAAVSGTTGRTSCEWVQLWAGGPKWATFNVGATITNYAQLTVGADATSYSNFTEQAPYYNTANVGGLYPWNNPNLNGRKTTWDKTVSTGISDVATTLWGSNWKTPTKEQLDTLQNSTYGKTTWTWCDGSTTQYVAGCTLKGYKVSGVGDFAICSIFLPAAGCFYSNNGAVDYASNDGLYWSSPETGNSRANYLGFYLDRRYIYYVDREYGRSVRAVLVP